eukprot:9126782-Alexandrium_andersonii.AAC.1
MNPRGHSALAGGTWKDTSARQFRPEQQTIFSATCQHTKPQLRLPARFQARPQHLPTPAGSCAHCRHPTSAQPATHPTSASEGPSSGATPASLCGSAGSNPPTRNAPQHWHP